MPGVNSPRIAVVGSLNMDLVMPVPTIPRPGETLKAEKLQTIPGGKGANQAVALARLGANVVMIGRVGDDAYGQDLKQGLADEGIDVAPVLVTPDCSSGIAVIAVAKSGENSIVIVAGANGRLTPADVESQAAAIRDSKMLVVQNEVPMATVTTAVQLAKDHGIPVIYDPAPAPQEPLPSLLWKVDVLTPNQSEAESLWGNPIHSVTDAIAAARTFRQRGVRHVVIKLGEKGALAVDDEDHVIEVPSRSVKVIDTTAAGDAFTAAMALSLCAGDSLEKAVRRACAAGALTVTRAGAQPSLPTKSEVDGFLEEWG